MTFGIDHFIRRVFEPFTPESRFYWPLVIAVALAMAANVAWYYLGERERRVAPAERSLRGPVLGLNLFILFWLLVLLYAKTIFAALAFFLVLNIATIAYLYFFWLPPRELAWEREQRRQRYIPQPQKKKRRKR